MREDLELPERWQKMIRNEQALETLLGVLPPGTQQGSWERVWCLNGKDSTPQAVMKRRNCSGLATRGLQH